MVTHVLKENDAGEPTIVLTTESAQSSYGIPVLRIENSDGPDYGPSDLIPGLGRADMLVFEWGVCADRTPVERDAAKRFLSQSPTGPHL